MIKSSMEVQTSFPDYGMVLKHILPMGQTALLHQYGSEICELELEAPMLYYVGMVNSRSPVMHQIEL